jgi:hypothetical protein
MGKHTPLPALFAALIFAASASAATYIAPTPPEAVPLRGSTTTGSHYDIFLSKRSPDEIRAFYAATIGTLTSQTRGADEADTPVILAYQKVVDILVSRHRDVTLADDLRVRIRWKPPGNGQVLGNGQASCAGDFFRELFAIAQIQKRQTEFDALCKQYGYLQNAYFQRVPDPHRAGQWIDADKDILGRAHENHGGQQAKALSATSAQTAQRIAQLALSGNGAAANALAGQLTQQATQTGNTVVDWNGWVEILKEGDAMGYRTWILIPTHPGTW